MATIADQIREYLGVQPADCFAVNRDRLANALAASGPVVFRGQVVSLEAGVDAPSFRFDASRKYTPAAPHVVVGEDGVEVVEIPPPPTDRDFAAQWGLTAAVDLPLGV
jgi:hypothetical protein